MRKSLLIPIIVLVCLGLFILFVFVLPRHQEEKSVLAPWNQKPITHLTIVHQQDEIVLTLQEQPTTQWYITSPRRALAEYGTVNQILQGLAAVGKYATPVEDPDPVAHGLDKPWLQISLGDATERTLLSLGKQTFNGRHYYMSLDDQTEYLVPTQVIDTFASAGLSFTTLRSKSIVHFYPWNVVSYSLDGLGPETVVLKKLDERTWGLEAPYRDLAEYTRASDIVWEYVNLRATDFFDDVEDLGEYSLDEPALTVTFQLQDGTSTTVLVSSKIEAENGFYLKTSDSNTVYFVRKYSILPLELTVDELTMSTLTRFSPGDLDEVAFRDETGEWIFVRAKDAWYCGTEEVSLETMTGLLNSLQGLAVEKADSQNLGQTKWEIRLDPTADPTPIVITIDENYRTRVTSRSRILQLDPQAVEALMAQFKGLGGS